MYSLNEVYGERFFEKRFKYSWRAPIVCGAIVENFGPKTVVDVGCAIGDLVVGFLGCGVEAWGIEGSGGCLRYLECDRDRLILADMRKPFEFPHGKVDLVTCFEVAEHLEPEFADQFVDNLAGMADVLVMSIAWKGQEGKYHYNCQPSGYWIRKFGDRGYLVDMVAFEFLREAWEPWKHKYGIKAFWENLIVFVR